MWIMCTDVAYPPNPAAFISLLFVDEYHYDTSQVVGFQSSVKNICPDRGVGGILSW